MVGKILVFSKVVGISKVAGVSWPSAFVGIGIKHRHVTVIGVLVSMVPQTDGRVTTYHCSTRPAAGPGDFDNTDAPAQLRYRRESAARALGNGSRIGRSATSFSTHIVAPCFLTFEGGIGTPRPLAGGCTWVIGVLIDRVMSARGTSA